MKQGWPFIALLALCALSFAYLVGLKHGREESNPPKHSKSANVTAFNGKELCGVSSLKANAT